MIRKQILLFVYGTLRTEFSKIGFKLQSDRVRGCLFDLGAFPGYYPFEVQDSEGNPIELSVLGEVIAVEPRLLPLLDRYEGIDRGLYSREKVTTESGLLCYIYQCHPGLARSGNLVMTGDWFDRDHDQSPDLTKIEKVEEEEYNETAPEA